MGETPLSWEQARYALSRLPPEIRLDIYNYTLIAERSIQVKDDEESDVLYRWEEPSEEATRELKRASDFYIWATPAINHNEVHDYFLHHNSFLIRNKAGADALAKAALDLSKSGFSTTVYALELLINGDRTTAEDGNEALRMVSNRRDYRRCDRSSAAFSAYRILKPLTKLYRIRSLHITLCEGRDHWSFFGIPHHDVYVFVPTVIAELKKLVPTDTKFSEFKVIHHIACGTDSRTEKDITEMWNPQSNKQRKKLRMKFKDLGSEVMGIHQGLEDQELEDEEFEMDDNEIYERFFRYSDDDDLPWNYEPTFSDMERWGYY